MKYQITNLQVFIRDKVQYIQFELSKSGVMVLDTYDAMKKIFNDISILEIEILNGEWVTLIDDCILWEENEEVTRIKKQYVTNQYKRIVSTNVYLNYSGNECVQITTSDNQVYSSRLKYFVTACGLQKEEFHLLYGSYISPTYFKVGVHDNYYGEVVFIKYNNKVINNFNFRVFGSIEENYNNSLNCEF
jgi:hypothetical protein